MVRDNLRAVDAAIEFLSGTQLPSGQFPTERSIREGWKEDGEFGPRSAELSPFSSAAIAESLSLCKDARAEAMISRVVVFLQNEMTRGGLWRYWCKGAPQYEQIPPDVDDTACISATLRHFGKPVPDNRAVLLANRNAEGLFYTWITPRAEFVPSVRWWWLVLTDLTYGRLIGFWNGGARRHHVDTVVNANVLYYLGDDAETERVTAWLVKTAEAGSEEKTDRSYRSRPAFYFALSRCFASGHRKLDGLQSSMARSFAGISKDDGSIGGDPLQTALALCAIHNFGMSFEGQERSIRYLLESQGDDGGWDWCPIYYDGRDVPLIHFGSRAVTTGYRIEALVRHSRARE